MSYVPSSPTDAYCILRSFQTRLRRFQDETASKTKKWLKSRDCYRLIHCLHCGVRRFCIPQARCPRSFLCFLSGKRCHCGTSLRLRLTCRLKQFFKEANWGSMAVTFWMVLSIIRAATLRSYILHSAVREIPWENSYAKFRLKTGNVPVCAWEFPFLTELVGGRFLASSTWIN